MLQISPAQLPLLPAIPGYRATVPSRSSDGGVGNIVRQPEGDAGLFAETCHLTRAYPNPGVGLPRNDMTVAMHNDL
jgi:hypothetical protein